MMTMRRAALGLVLALLPFAASSQYQQTFGDVVAHYSALSTERLLPDMAKHYGIARERNRGLVNLALERAGNAASVRATVTGTATSIAGDKQPIHFRELVEDGTVSYLGEFVLSAPDTYTFAIAITPENGAAYTLKFTQDFVRE
jgi:hypothetical protein